MNNKIKLFYSLMFKILILFQGIIICATKMQKTETTQNSIYINGKLFGIKRQKFHKQNTKKNFSNLIAANRRIIE